MNHNVITLGEIATLLGAELRGDAGTPIKGIATLSGAGEGDLAFLSNPTYARYLADTRASAVILNEAAAAQCPTNVLIMDNPYLGYARLSHRFSKEPQLNTGIDPSASVDPSARVAQSAVIGPRAIISANVIIEDNVSIGAGVFVGAASTIGPGSRIYPNCTLYHDVHLGERCIVHSGAVIGADGFGYANDKGEWVKIAQLGGVRLGNDVEVGANTTIDRGALEDTRIGNGVKLDNLVMIAHNVVIGEQTALAGCAGVAGSSNIGRNCVVGGGSCISGHLTVADQVHLTGMAMVTHDIKEPGVYSSGTGVEDNRKWRKSVVRFRQLDEMARRIKQLEKQVEQLTGSG
ncbi:MAG: UDP-3-O-(3-hydroxymyristoyl)glucosamine N-acyltransferase [Alteromonadaceae bacterium]|nr:UDP-3-O-(3-hydroxymyristoyl)glucosamine N-acyltransferase [Alteromonadaceae bacterium]